MKQQIINILEKHSIKNSDVTGEWYLLEDDMFPQVAEEIEKLYNKKPVERDIVYVEESPLDDHEFSLMRRSDDDEYRDRYDEKVIRHFKTIRVWN